MKAAVAVLLASGTATAAPAVKAVYTDVGEARACLPLDGGGALVGTGGGLVRLAADGQIERVWTASDGLPGTRIEDLARVGDTVWIGTDAGAAQLAGQRIVHASSGRGVRDVIAFDGATYAATWDGGVQRLDGDGDRGKPLPFAGDKQTGARARVAALAVADHALFAGTAAGLYRLVHGRFERVALPALPASATIAGLAADGDTLWLATTDGLYARDAAGGLRGYGGGDLRHVAIRGGDVIAAGVADGLVQVDRGRLVALPGAPRGLAIAETITVAGDATCAGGLDGVWLQRDAASAWIRGAHRDGPPSNDISALAADGDTLWVGTFDHGLAVRAHGAWRTISHPEIDVRINALYVEHRVAAASRIWVATANGLSTIDAASGAISRVARQDGLPGRGVIALVQLRDGRMLAGTSWGAVTVGGPHPDKVGPDQDLGAVWAIAEDADGMLWLGTTTGLYRGAIGTGPWQRYSVATGHLRDDWVMSIVVRDRTLFVGTYHGGVSRLDLAAPNATIAGALADVTATQLGDGWINPGGLALAGDQLLASTMDGLRIGDGVTAAWTAQPELPGKDTTATLRVGGTLWVATRRGLAELR